MTSTVVSGARASSSAPTTKVTAASRMAIRRPRRSVSTPAASAPAIAPNVTQLVMTSMTMVLGWKVLSIPSRAPEMTPWS
jgi:hypothetical protein